MRRPAIAVFFVLWLSGCGSQALRYSPSAGARALQGADEVRLFVGRVVDLSGGFDAPRAFQAELNASLPRNRHEIYQAAFIKELGRLGVRLVTAPDEADAVFDAALRDIRVREMPIRLEMTFTLRLRDRAGRSLWTGDLSASAQEPVRLGLYYPLIRRLTNAALAGVMTNLGPLFESERLLEKISAARGSGVAASAPTKRPGAAPPQPARVFSDVDELPPASLPARPNAHAVVIGVRKYRSLPEADFADGDARLMARYLTGVLGFAEANVALMVNDEAARGDFAKNLERRLSNRVKQGDEVLIYYSGHGAPDPATSEPYLVPYDGDPAYLEDTGYSIKRLYAFLGKLPAGRVTVILDSCFSGAGGRSVLAKGARPLVSVKDPAAIPERVSVLSSSAGDQISQSYRDKGHGIFTYYLLKGIKERVGSKAVDFKSVFDAAVPQVSETARRLYNADQTPQWRGAQP